MIRTSLFNAIQRYFIDPFSGILSQQCDKKAQSKKQTLHNNTLICHSEHIIRINHHKCTLNIKKLQVGLFNAFHLVNKNRSSQLFMPKIGMTLVETLMASIIFSLVMASVLGTYVVLMNNYKASRNLMHVSNLTQNMQMHLQSRLSATYYRFDNEQESTMDKFFEKVEDEKNIPEEDIDEEMVLDILEEQENEEESGYGFANSSFPDFSFKVASQGENSTLEFVYYLQSEMTPNKPGLHRIKYFVQDEILYSETISPYLPFKDMVHRYFAEDESEAEIKKEEMFRYEPLCDRVKSFKVKLKYYKDYGFTYTEQWDSIENMNKFPDEDEDDEDDYDDDYNEEALSETEYAPDGLPSGVLVELELILDPKNESTKKMIMCFDLPAAIDNWYEAEDPEDSDDDD